MAETSGTIRVLIVDDHRMFADALRLALDGEPDVEVVGVAGGADQVDEAARRLSPAVALVDLDTPGRDPVEIVRAVLRGAPGAAVLALLAQQSDLLVARSVEAGAAGHLSKYEPVGAVIELVRRAATEKDLLGPRERRRLMGRLHHRRAEQATAQQRADRLTARELEIMQHIANGESPVVIAATLGMSPATLRTHVQNVIMKLGVHSKTEALAFAIRHGKVSARS
ncbi:MAG: response regulator transcription factor [Actinomycetota bacterium]